MSTTPEGTHLYFHFHTDGSLKLACSGGDYENTMFSSDLYPTESFYMLKTTVDTLYHAIKHLERHIKPGAVETFPIVGMNSVEI